MSRAGNRVGEVGGPARDCDLEGLRTSLLPSTSSSKPLGRNRLPQSWSVTARTGSRAREAGSSSSARSSSRLGFGGASVLGRCPSTGIAFEGCVPGAESCAGIEVVASIVRELISWLEVSCLHTLIQGLSLRPWPRHDIAFLLEASSKFQAVPEPLLPYDMDFGLTAFVELVSVAHLVGLVVARTE